MSRPKPDCAWCGGELQGQAFVIHTWHGIKTSPSVGWHDRCSDLDSLYKARKPGEVWSNPEKLLKIIADRCDKKRGTYRIVRHCTENEKGGVRYFYARCGT